MPRGGGLAVAVGGLLPKEVVEVLPERRHADRPPGQPLQQVARFPRREVPRAPVEQAKFSDLVLVGEVQEQVCAEPEDFFCAEPAVDRDPQLHQQAGRHQVGVSGDQL